MKSKISYSLYVSSLALRVKIKLLAAEIKKSYSSMPLLVEIYLRRGRFYMSTVNVSCCWGKGLPLRE